MLAMASFVFDKADIYIVLVTIIILYAAGAWKNKLPSNASVHSMVSLIDTKGGNILILGLLAIYFFHRTEEMYYAVMKLVHDGAIASDNGTALNGLLFCNGAFSGVIGALLKVMTGTEPSVPPPGGTTSTTVTTTSSVLPSKTPTDVKTDVSSSSQGQETQGNTT